METAFDVQRACQQCEAMQRRCADNDPPISDGTVEATQEFLLAVAEEIRAVGVTLDHPELNPCCDGSISVYWDRLDSDAPDRPWVEISVLDDGLLETRTDLQGKDGATVSDWTVSGWTIALDAVADYAVTVEGRD